MPARRYTFDERAGDYGLADNRGRFVSRRDIRRSLDGALARGAEATRALTERLARREITLADWQLAMAREIRAATLAGLATAHGGFDRLSPAHYGRAGAHLKAEWVHLREWAAKLAAGAPVDGKALVTAGRYIATVRRFHEREVGRDRVTRGFDEVRSIRNARDSCTSAKGRTGCIEIARRGFMPVDQYVPPGERVCRGGCVCFSLYRRSSTGEVAA